MKTILFATLGALIIITTVVLSLVTEPKLGGTTDKVDVGLDPNAPREALQITASKTDGETTYIGSYDQLKFDIAALEEQKISLQAKIDYYQAILTEASVKLDAAGVPPEGTKFATTSEVSK